MKHPIIPETLRTLRERQRLSQAQLADRTRGKLSVSLPTIKRIETATGTYMANPRVAKGLAKALRVEIDVLAKEPAPDELDHKRKLQQLGMRQLRTFVPENTSLAFRMVEHLYGIPIRAQIEMAPLCMALLAEGSLAWRRKRLAEICQKAEELYSLGGGSFSFARAVYRTQDAGLEEAESIRKRDVFGREVAEDTYDLGYDPNTNNPFADYLRELARDLDDADIALDPDGIPEIGQYGFPEYRIGAAMLDELAGGDPDAEYALTCGHVRLADIPDELLGEDNTEKRVEWIVSQIPEDELADRKEAHKLFASINIDTSTSNRDEQGGHSQ